MGQAVFALRVLPGGPSATLAADTTAGAQKAGKGIASLGIFIWIIIGAMAVVLAVIFFILTRRTAKRKDKAHQDELRRQSEEAKRKQDDATRREEELKKQLEARQGELSPSHSAPGAGQGEAQRIPAARGTQSDDQKAVAPSRKTMIGSSIPTYTQGKVKVLNGSLAGKEFDVTRSETTIGAEVGNTIVLEEDTVSRRHATIRFATGQFQISDNRSTNGTRVNGQPIQVTILKDGDTIRLGKCELQFTGR
jgi:pSer/pThr/pTyr-binding forkhead associated (FHA) protein